MASPAESLLCIIEFQLRKSSALAGQSAGSALIKHLAGAGHPSSWMFSARTWRNILANSDIKSFTSTTLGRMICRRPNARSWLVRFEARSAAPIISQAKSRHSCGSPLPSRITCPQPIITVNRLLKSCDPALWCFRSTAGYGPAISIIAFRSAWRMIAVTLCRWLDDAPDSRRRLGPDSVSAT